MAQTSLGQLADETRHHEKMTRYQLSFTMPAGPTTPDGYGRQTIRLTLGPPPW